MTVCLVNGIRIAYVAVGAGLPILLIHGFPLDRSTWSPQVSVLSKWYSVITPDLRGHGGSDVPPGPYSMSLLANDMLGLLNALRIQEAVICGISMGGYVALAMYRMCPHGIKALILVNTRATADCPARRAERRRMFRCIQGEGLEHLANQQLLSFLSASANAGQTEIHTKLRRIILNIAPTAAMGTLEGMAVRPSQIDLLPQIRVPTLIVAGRDDRGIPYTESERMHRLIPDSRLRLIAHAGHLVNLEQPVAFNAAVLDFLREEI